MSRQPTTRQELYNRIRESSKDEVILEEMIRLGFWMPGQAVEGDPADEIRRKGELERQLRALTTERARLKNVEALKRELRKQRLEESRRNRQENKQRKLEDRQRRAAAWCARQQHEIVYLGRGSGVVFGTDSRPLFVPIPNPESDPGEAPATRGDILVGPLLEHIRTDRHGQCVRSCSSSGEAS